MLSLVNDQLIPDFALYSLEFYFFSKLYSVGYLRNCQISKVSLLKVSKQQLTLNILLQINNR